jgi:hypothetical protein
MAIAGVIELRKYPFYQSILMRPLKPLPEAESALQRAFELKVEAPDLLASFCRETIDNKAVN